MTTAAQHPRASATASNVRAEMARQKRKGVELARVLGISQAATSRRLNGELPLDVNELFAIADWLNVSPLVLMGEPSPGTTERYSFDSADLLAVAA